MHEVGVAFTEVISDICCAFGEGFATEFTQDAGGVVRKVGFTCTGAAMDEEPTGAFTAVVYGIVEPFLDFHVGFFGAFVDYVVGKREAKRGVGA